MFETTGRWVSRPNEWQFSIYWCVLPENSILVSLNWIQDCKHTCVLLSVRWFKLHSGLSRPKIITEYQPWCLSFPLRLQVTFSVLVEPMHRHCLCNKSWCFKDVRSPVMHLKRVDEKAITSLAPVCHIVNSLGPERQKTVNVWNDLQWLPTVPPPTSSSQAVWSVVAELHFNVCFIQNYYATKLKSESQLSVIQNSDAIWVLICMYLLLEHIDCHCINGISCPVSVLFLNLNRVEIDFEEPKGCRTVRDTKCALPPLALIVIWCLEAAFVTLPLVSNSSISYFWQIATSANSRGLCESRCIHP